jgi:hypothetical protein
MQELEKENFDLKHQIFYLKEKLGARAANASEGGNLIEDNILLEKQVKELEADNQKKGQKLHSYTQILTKSTAAIQKYEQEKRANALDLINKKARVGSLTSSLQEKESLLGQAQQEIMSLQPQLQTANEQVQVSQQTIEDLAAKGEQQGAQLSESNEQLLGLRERLLSTDSELQTSRMEVSRLHGAAQAMAEDDGAQKATLTGQRQSLEQSQQQCSALSLEVGRLTAKCEALTQQVAELERGSKLLLEQKHQAMQSAQQKTAEVEQLKQTVQSRQNSLDDNQRELQHLQAEREQQLASAKEQWCQELAEADRRQQRMRGTFDQHQQGVVQKHEEEKAEWQEKLGSLTAQVMELSAAKVALEARERALMHEGQQVTQENREVRERRDESTQAAPPRRLYRLADCIPWLRALFHLSARITNGLHQQSASFPACYVHTAPYVKHCPSTCKHCPSTCKYCLSTCKYCLSTCKHCLSTCKHCPFSSCITHLAAYFRCLLSLLFFSHAQMKVSAQQQLDAHEAEVAKQLHETTEAMNSKYWVLEEQHRKVKSELHRDQKKLGQCEDQTRSVVIVPSVWLLLVRCRCALCSRTCLCVVLCCSSPRPFTGRLSA